MPNNFKLRGDYYVSKAGSDSNDGLTPDTPKRTVQAALNLLSSGNRTIIVGSGVYRETLSRGSAASWEIYSDGIVIFESPNVNGSLGMGSTTGGAIVRLYDITFLNYASIGPVFAGAFAPTIQFIRCKFYNCTIISAITTSGLNLISSIIINSTLPAPSGTPSLNFCTVLNSNLTVNTSIATNSYINQNSIITSLGLTAANFNYNNIQGVIIMNVASTVTSGVIQDAYGRYYDLSIATSTGDGTIGNPYGRPYTLGAGFNFTNHRIAYPTFNANSFSSDPKFNNILKQDFSLQPDSPHIARASDFTSNIGGTPVATRVDASGSLFSGSNAITDNFVFNSGDYVISGSAVTGSVTSAPIFVSSSAKVIQEIDYNGLLAFNKDTTAPTGSNVNVPDVLTYTSASNQPGANPDRLTYYMRWTTGSSQPVSDAQWENGGLWPAGSFNTFEWNTKPSVDFLGRGNGDQNFNIINTPTFVKATWIQLRVTLRNDYLI